MRRSVVPTSEVLSFESDESTSVQAEENTPKQTRRPGTSSGRKSTKTPKDLSEFRKYFEQEELPLKVENKNGERIVSWTASLDQLDYGHFLPICLSGFQDLLEPYPSFAFDAAMELLENGADDERVLRALPLVMQQIKAALSTREKAVVHRVLLVLQQLVVCEGAGEALTDYYRAILPLCNILQDKHLGTGDELTTSLVAETLETIEAYGKDDAHIMIQQYVPAYQVSCGNQ